MGIEAIELHRLAMPLVRPFETAVGRYAARDVLLVQVRTDAAEGWGECVAGANPYYTSEYTASAEAVLRDYLVPALLEAPQTTAEDFAGLVAPVIGHRMAKAALETALLDAELRAKGVSFAQHFGAVRDRVDCGVAVGIAPTVEALLAEVSGYIDEGYRRIKLKIAPGWDVEPVRAVRRDIGDAVLLQVDAVGSYTAADLDHLHLLDEFDLLLIEQPFAAEDIRAHILLAESIDTPVCLDTSVTSAAVAVDLIERGATAIVDVKAGRLGGYLEAVRVHDVCAELSVAVWCGGMLETGVGRAANVALSALENFLLPGDTSASNRYFTEDLTEPFVLTDGQLDVPTGPGSGVSVREDLVRDWAVGPSLLLRAG